MKYLVGDKWIEYKVEGERSWGPEEVLLQQAVDLTSLTSWKENGFIIEKLFEQPLLNTFQKNTRKLLLTLWRKAGLQLPDDFELDQYHTLIHSWQQHLDAIEFTKLIPVHDFPVAIHLLEERISEICRQKLEVKNPFDHQSVFHFRVIRPNTTDNNPLHRDVWLEDYKDCINLYIPVAGSNELSSLILIPGSHQWQESRIERTNGGAVMNSIKFNVPAVTSIAGNFETIRPAPLEDEVLVFSPYLIHGGAVNLHPSSTRISIEIRLWKKS